MTSTSAKSGKPYRIDQDPLCGRQLVATRRILAGELIIDEPALLTGPGFARGNKREREINFTLSTEPTSDSIRTSLLVDFTQEDHSVCLVCCTNLTLASATKCLHCGLLLCSESCQSHFQHVQNECLVFPKLSHVWNRTSRSRKSLYNLVLVIRGLFYKFRDPYKWDQIRMLESKSEALTKIGAFSELQEVFNCLSWSFFSSSPPENFINNNTNENANNVSLDSLEDIVEAAKHCLGVLRTNAFSSFSESYSREGLFFLSSLMSHSCVINTDRQTEAGISSGGNIVKMVVRASVDIEKDEPITTTYLSLLHNTEERNRIMISTWLFTCHCLRCQDPHECQAHSATIFNGPSEQWKVADNHNLYQPSLEYHFHALSSSHKHPESTRRIQQIISFRPRNLYEISNLEDWLDQYDNGSILHPHHSLFIHVKLFLCQYYGRQNGGFDALSMSQLKRKVIYCKQILNIYDRVAPGIQMCRGGLRTL